MFTKTIITLSAALTLATSFASIASAQTGQNGVRPYTEFERLWFSIPEGRDHYLPR